MNRRGVAQPSSAASSGGVSSPESSSSGTLDELAGETPALRRGSWRECCEAVALCAAQRCRAGGAAVQSNMEINQPTLETKRLWLRPLLAEDAPVLRQQAGRREIADTTISIPHPYSESQAREWIVRQASERAAGKAVVFAVQLRQPKQLIGTVGLREIDPEHAQAEIGFWIGVDWWGEGYATEAAGAVVRYSFERLSLNRIYAHHMVRNPASGRVVEKIGMRREGLLRQRVRKWDVFEDVVLWAILREDWNWAGDGDMKTPGCR